jgi:endonuclease/exonuclease/phosphatase (EEP) superfamily protein YafD
MAVQRRIGMVGVGSIVCATWGLAALGAVGCRGARAPDSTTSASTSAPRSTEAPSPAVVAERGPTLELVTYNVNYGLAGDPSSLAAIAAPDADVVLLQETNEAWQKAIEAKLRERYPHRRFDHCCLAGGLALLSKHPIVESELLEARDWFPALRAVIDTPLGKIQLLNVHLRPQMSESGSVVSGYFTTPPIREREIAAYHAELTPGLPTLVAGDFNEGASGRAIVYLGDRGYRSALPDFAGSAATWRWRTSIGTVATQLDHIVHDARLEPLDVRVLARGRSDHLPVVAVFRRAPVVSREPRACGTSSTPCSGS